MVLRLPRLRQARGDRGAERAVLEEEIDQLLDRLPPFDAGDRVGVGLDIALAVEATLRERRQPADLGLGAFARTREQLVAARVDLRRREVAPGQARDVRPQKAARIHEPSLAAPAGGGAATAVFAGAAMARRRLEIARSLRQRSST